MSQAKIEQYKKEKANRKANVKKAKTKKKITMISLIVVGILLVAFLIWGIIATIQDGGLTKYKEQQDQDLVTQELIEYLNSSSGSDTTTDDTATHNNAE